MTETPEFGVAGAYEASVVCHLVSGWGFFFDVLLNLAFLVLEAAGMGKALKGVLSI